MRLLPLRGHPAAILPLVSGCAWTAKDADKLRGGNFGKVFLEGHGQIIPQKKKCAMQKIMLAMHTRKGHCSRVSQPHTEMKTTTPTTTIRLRNKLTGLFYVEGKNFSGTESEATVIERNSPSHLVIRYTYTMPGMEDNIEEVEVSLLRRVTKRKDGIEKIERLSFGDTGRNIHGEAARGHWIVKGYKKDGKFSLTLRGLKAKLK